MPNKDRKSNHKWQQLVRIYLCHNLLSRCLSFLCIIYSVLHSSQPDIIKVNMQTILTIRQACQREIDLCVHPLSLAYKETEHAKCVKSIRREAVIISPGRDFLGFHSSSRVLVVQSLARVHWVSSWNKGHNLLPVVCSCALSLSCESGSRSCPFSNQWWHLFSYCENICQLRTHFTSLPWKKVFSHSSFQVRWAHLLDLWFRHRNRDCVPNFSENNPSVVLTFLLLVVRAGILTFIELVVKADILIFIMLVVTADILIFTIIVIASSRRCFNFYTSGNKNLTI